MFLDFLEAGLVTRRTAKVNWDPVDQTVLANEQVIDGRGWRSGALVEQRELTQWFFKITAFAQDLLDKLDTLERWPEKVSYAEELDRALEGLLVRFPLDPATTPSGEDELEIYTTRPDTLFGAKFMAVAPDHPLAKACAEKNPELAAFIEECKRTGTAAEAVETAEKLGFDTGVRAVHPFDPSWTLPVYVANFILMEYGTGAIFGCRRTTSATRLRPQVRPRHTPGAPARTRTRHLRHHGRRLRRGRDDQLRASSTGSTSRPPRPSGGR
jgi:leucyl-tRNA synthetase